MQRSVWMEVGAGSKVQNGPWVEEAIRSPGLDKLETGRKYRWEAGILTSSLHFIWNMMSFLMAYIDSHSPSSLSPPHTPWKRLALLIVISAYRVSPSTNYSSILWNYSVTIQQNKWSEWSGPCRKDVRETPKPEWSLTCGCVPSYGRVHTSSNKYDCWL